MTERTTVRLPEDLIRLAKRKAADEGRSLTSLIEDGLRRVVADERKAPKKSTSTASQHGDGRSNARRRSYEVFGYSGDRRSRICRTDETL
jgi:hypothetical protein